jgi:hypothetical protein
MVILASLASVEMSSALVMGLLPFMVCLRFPYILTPEMSKPCPTRYPQVLEFGIQVLQSGLHC